MGLGEERVVVVFILQTHRHLGQRLRLVSPVRHNHAKLVTCSHLVVKLSEEEDVPLEVDSERSHLLHDSVTELGLARVLVCGQYLCDGGH